MVVAQANYCIFLYSQIFNAQSPINNLQCNLYCNIDDQDDQYDYWYAFFESIEKDNAFFKKKRVRDKGVPYMTSTWKEAIRNKRNNSVCNSVCKESNTRDFGTQKKLQE